MKPANQPICCTPAAYTLMARAVASVESSDGLLSAAVALSIHELSDVQPNRIDHSLQQMADTIRQRVRGSQPQALLAYLHQYLFDELGFCGAQEDYYRAANSYLPTVLHDRKGLPIALCLIYKLIGERLGLKISGVGLPGHFLVAVETDGSRMFVDPYNGGRVVSVDDAMALVRNRFGEEMEWSEEFLRPVSHVHWITRMIQNLLHVFGEANQYNHVAAMLEMEILLWPKQTHLQRDLALVLARIGHARSASRWLDTYLRTNPDDPQRSDLIQLLEVLSA